MELEKKLERDENLTLQELDALIQKVKENYWPKLKEKEVPKSCQDCQLFKFCQRINEKLICPWIQD